MLNDIKLPDLTFPEVKLGERETPWNLAPLLFRDGAATHTRRVAERITNGSLGAPQFERIPLVTKIHESINGKLVSGGSFYSANASINNFRYMFTWAERTGAQITLDSVEKVYLAWTDSLVHRQQVVKDLVQCSAYSKASVVGNILDDVLQRPFPLITMTRLRVPNRRKRARTIKAEKQNLADTFEFGHFLQDICDALPFNVVLRGALPVHIPLRRGGELIEWSGYTNWKSVLHHRANPLTDQTPGKQRRAQRKCLARFEAWESDGTLRTRRSLANKRSEAELLLFIGQTGMNFTQAHRLKLAHFSYASHLDGYVVRDRKGRRGGDVLFEIYREYKPHFERYLDWRRQLFPDSDDLFPLEVEPGRAFLKLPQFGLRYTCESIGLAFVSPRKLRNTRVNWLLRRTGDPDLTAAMAQHSKETLLEVYEQPSQQRAMTEVTHFWAQHDPSLSAASAGPGECDGNPVPLKDLPKEVLMPDCIRPSGCLWCEHHRDIDSHDYVWSLACFRHLKIIEVSVWTPPKGQARESHPAQLVVNRITDKLRWFRDSNQRRQEWVDEALARVEEGNYHPDWRRRINAMEGTA
jgi:hypothetical protein